MSVRVSVSRIVHLSPPEVELRIDTGSIEVRMTLGKVDLEQIENETRRAREWIERQEMRRSLEKTRRAMEAIRSHGPPLTDEERRARELRKLSVDIQEAAGGYVPEENDDRE